MLSPRLLVSRDGGASVSSMYVANAYGVTGSPQQLLNGPVVFGDGPDVSVAGCGPFATGAFGTGTMVVSITTPGPLGTAIALVSFNGSPLGPLTTASTAPLNPSSTGLTFSFSAGTYETFHTWTWTVGVTPTSTTTKTSEAAIQTVAVGPTPVDCATNVTAGATSAWYRFDTSAAAHGLTLPANPYDGMVITASDVTGNANTNPIVILPGGSLGIQDPYNANTVSSADRALAIPFESVTWTYDATKSIWRVTADSSAALPSLRTTTGTVTLTGRTDVQSDTSGGTVTINMPANPTEGMTVKITDVTGNAAAHAISVAPNGSGQHIQPLNASGPSGIAQNMTTNYQSATWMWAASSATWWLTAVN